MMAWNEWAMRFQDRRTTTKPQINAPVTAAFAVVVYVVQHAAHTRWKYY